MSSMWPPPFVKTAGRTRGGLERPRTVKRTGREGHTGQTGSD